MQWRVRSSRRVRGRLRKAQAGGSGKHEQSEGGTHRLVGQHKQACAGGPRACCAHFGRAHRLTWKPSLRYSASAPVRVLRTWSHSESEPHSRAACGWTTWTHDLNLIQSLNTKATKDVHSGCKRGKLPLTRCPNAPPAAHTCAASASLRHMCTPRMME